MIKNIIINIDGVSDEADLKKLSQCLDSIDAIEKYKLEQKVNVLSISYDSRALSHANHIYNQIRDYGFIIK